MQAKQFVKIMSKLVLPHGGTGLILAHPSMEGMRSGSGTGGTTGWNNAYRWRGYLERILDQSGQEIDDARRVLRTKKANYGPKGGEIELRYQNGVFRVAGASNSGTATMDPMWKEKRADRVFTDLLRWHRDNNIEVSAANNGTKYAPRLFKKEADRQGVTYSELEDSMRRLLNSKQIENAPFGAPSKGAHRLYIPPVNSNVNS
jgi:RecA-family ATPase